MSPLFAFRANKFTPSAHARLLRLFRIGLGNTGVGRVNEDGDRPRCRLSSWLDATRLSSTSESIRLPGGLGTFPHKEMPEVAMA
jgi:hypothetical protein